MRTRLGRAGLILLGIALLVIVGIALNRAFGLPFDTTLRIACAAACLSFILKLKSDYPGESWPRISFWVSLAINAGIFFTPLVDRPPSRGELMVFALPDAVVVLAVRTATYKVADIHQRAVRQQMILGLVLAVAFCAILLGMGLIDPSVPHR